MVYLFLFSLGFAFSHANASDNRPIPAGSQISELVEKCEHGSADDCRIAGVMYRYGYGIHVDAREATRLFETGCKYDDSKTCGWASTILMPGGKLKNGNRARALAHKGCELGNVTSCNNEAYSYTKVEPKDEKKAEILWEEAREQAEMECERGELHSCALLGYYLIKGRGGQIDSNRGLELLRSVCAIKANDIESIFLRTEACADMARYEYSTADSPKARINVSSRLLEFCPATGNRAFYVCTTLANWADKEDVSLNGVTKDQWLMRGCDSGSGDSCLALGKAAKSEVERTNYFKQSCATLNDDGCNEYAKRLETGTEMDKARAAELRRFMCSVNDALCSQ